MCVRWGKGITNIEYNYLNLPIRITFTGNRKIDFIYDATGKKWRKVVNNNGTETFRDYIDGAEYQNGQQDIIHFSEGYIQRDATTDGDVNWKGWVYKYTLKDHLGNTRVTYSDKNNDGLVGVSDIEQVNHYYAFGLNMEGSWNGADGAFKNQYNGKEWNDDFGLGWNDYGARFYDAAVGRWNAVDPLAEIYLRHNPYNYTMNNPIRFIDPDGMQTVYDWDAHNKGEKGKYKDENGEDVSWDNVQKEIGIGQNTKNEEPDKKLRPVSVHVTDENVGVAYLRATKATSQNPKEVYEVPLYKMTLTGTNEEGVEESYSYSVVRVGNKKGEPMTMEAGTYNIDEWDPNAIDGSGGYHIQGNYYIHLGRRDVDNINGESMMANYGCISLCKVEGAPNRSAMPHSLCYFKNMQHIRK